MALEKLKSNSDFKNVYNKGRSLANKYLVLYFLRNGSNESRVGFSISKKVGNAVKRNRVRRLLTEAYRLNISCIGQGWDMIIIVRPKFIENISFDEINASFIKLLKKSGVYKEEDSQI